MATGSPASLNSLDIGIYGEAPEDESSDEYDELFEAISEALESIAGAAVSLFAERFPNLTVYINGSPIQPR